MYLSTEDQKVQIKRGPYRTPSKGLLSKKKPEEALKKNHERSTRVLNQNYALKKSVQRRDEKVEKLEKDIEKIKTYSEKEKEALHKLAKEKLLSEQTLKKEIDELTKTINVLQSAADNLQKENETLSVAAFFNEEKKQKKKFLKKKF